MGKFKTNQKKDNKKLIIGTCISIVLIIAIVVSIIYKYDRLEQAEQKEIPREETPQLIEPEKQLEELKEQPEQSKELLEQPKIDEKLTNGYIDGQLPATEPTYIKEVLIVNKKNPLPATYNKGEDPAARAAFEKMATAGRVHGIELVAFSGFRSYEYQTTLYNNYVNRDGQEKADRYSARPGHSEHQSGLAFDIGEKGREDLWLTSEFGKTEAGRWLVENAHQYGFILRYPEGKEDITGFMYESWHFRYLEGDLATKVFKSGLTLEEYLNIN